MAEKPENNINNGLINNIKYWLLGSILCFNVGWIVTIVICILFPNSTSYYITTIITCLAPFTCALIIKFIKKDMPWYFYITTGLIYIITCFYLIECVYEFIQNIGVQGIKAALANLNTGDINDYSNYGLLVILGIVCLTSFFGGFTVDVYRYFKGRHFEPSSRYNK